PFWGIMLLTTYLTQPFVAVLSRARESTADRTAATVIGSPATLASALSTLDDRIAKIPAEDLREASSLSSLSILPLDPIQTDPDSTPDPDSDSESLLAPLAPKWWWRVGWMLFATHPPTERRIAVLTALTEDQQRTLLPNLVKQSRRNYSIPPYASGCAPTDSFRRDATRSCRAAGNSVPPRTARHSRRAAL